MLGFDDVVGWCADRGDVGASGNGCRGREEKSGTPAIQPWGTVTGFSHTGGPRIEVPATRTFDRTVEQEFAMQSRSTTRSRKVTASSRRGTPHAAVIALRARPDLEPDQGSVREACAAPTSARGRVPPGPGGVRAGGRARSGERLRPLRAGLCLLRSAGPRAPGVTSNSPSRCDRTSRLPARRIVAR